MNRSATALTCLEKLAGQTQRPSRILVVNNHSADDTLEVLRSFQEKEEGLLRVIDLDDNLGNAGGMEIAMSEAFAEGADAVWILDDDSWPESDALEKLLEGTVSTDTIRASRVIDPATGELSWPLQIPEDGAWRLITSSDELPHEESFQIRRSWLGALVPRRIFEAVGPVNGALFLRGEDEDYPRRIERAGFKARLMRDSVLHHPPGGKLLRWVIFGQEIVLEQNLSGDKLYYRLRNAWWLERQSSGTLRAVFEAVTHGVALMKWGRPLRIWLPIWLEAFQDAMMDKLGKRNSKV